jgi:hypothetical protein
VSARPSRGLQVTAPRHPSCRVSSQPSLLPVGSRRERKHSCNPSPMRLSGVSAVSSPVPAGRPGTNSSWRPLPIRHARCLVRCPGCPRWVDDRRRPSSRPPPIRLPGCHPIPFGWTKGRPRGLHSSVSPGLRSRVSPVRRRSTRDEALYHSIPRSKVFHGPCCFFHWLYGAAAEHGRLQARVGWRRLNSGSAGRSMESDRPLEPKKLLVRCPVRRTLWCLASVCPGRSRRGRSRSASWRCFARSAVRCFARRAS